MTTHSFAMTKVETGTPKYVHGYTPEQELEIKEAKKAIDTRDWIEEPITLEEVKVVIVPFNRIHRVEQFVLHEVKAKATGTRTRAPAKAKVPRVKKLTKKAIQDRISELVMKQAVGETLSEEEQEFFNEHLKGLPKL